MSISALIIDDEQLAREELKYLLDSVGGVDVVAQGANGIEAVDLIEEHHPDLVFLDVQMPGQDGFAVIQRLMERRRAKTALRRRRSAEPLPQFVFATAYDQYAVRAFDVNAVDYLLKPFDRARVLEAVERVRARMAGSGANGCRRDGSPIESQLDALLRLLNRPQGAARGRAAGQADCAGAEPAAARRSGGDLLRGHRRGRDPRGDAGVRGAIEVPHARRIAGAAGSGAFLARASRLCGEYRPDPRSDAVVQIELPAAHERQAADRDPGEPRADQAAAASCSICSAAQS